MITAIVPAAGQSRRMGRPKLLLPFGESSVIETVVNSLRACPISEVVVVTGHTADDVENRLIGNAKEASSGVPLRFVRNPDYLEGGMLSSIQCGIHSASPRTEWYLVALADQPGLTPDTVGHLIAAARAKVAATDSQRVFIPVYQGRRGHPVLIDSRLRDDIDRLCWTNGLRDLWHQHPEIVHLVPVESAFILDDLDTPDDYTRAVTAFRPREDNA